MSDADELIAAQLLDEFLDALLDGKTPAGDDYLRRCPVSEWRHLSDAMLGASFLHRYHYTARYREDPGAFDAVLGPAKERKR